MGKAAEAPNTDKASAAQAAPRPTIQLNPTRMQDAEYARVVRVVTAEPGTTLEDLQRQDYWAHVANTMSPWMRMEVRADDGSFYAEGLVLEAGRNWATVKILQSWNLDTADVARTRSARMEEYAGLPYYVMFRGEHELWSVIRKSDNAVMHEKEGTRAGADRWLQERLKADK